MYWITFTLLGSFTSLANVSAEKSNIMVNTARVPWISMEKLTTLLEVSYDVSKCCNVYLSGKSATVEKVFNEFAEIYPYAYTINNRTYDCNGYFMISESTENLVTDIKNIPTTIATTEILIIVDDSVEDSAKLFNVSMYENANVNIAARNGLWTLSTNILGPRVIKRVSRLSEMVRKRDILNFEGRELKAAAVHFPPLCYLESTDFKTGDRSENFAYYLGRNDSEEEDGVEFKILAKALSVLMKKCVLISYYRLMKEILNEYFIPFAVQPRLLKPVDKVMVWLKESGLVQYHMKDVLRRRTTFAHREVLIEHDNFDSSPRVLTLTPLAAAFGMLIVDLCISTVAFFTELYYFSRKKSIRQVLLNIKRTRDLRRAMDLRRKNVVV